VSPVTRLRALYFLYYGYVGTFLPFFAVYLTGLGFTGKQIGIIQMLPSFPLAPIVAMGWASFADNRSTPQRALRLATAAMALASSLLLFARTPIEVGAVIVLMALGDRAVVPLLDSVTLEYCRQRRDEPGVSYTRIRLFGSLGFILLTVVVGRSLTLRGARPADIVVPATVIACVGLCTLVAWTPTPTPSSGERATPREMLALLRDRRLWLLLAPAALHWAACAPYHVFFGVLVRDLHLRDDVTSAGMAIGVVAEIAVLVVFARLERLFPLRGLLALAFIGSAVRWWLLSRVSDPRMLAGLQALHGLTFGLFWGSAMHALADVVPPRLRATGQAVFATVVFGVANAIGYALAGAGYDGFGGARPLFVWAAVTELIAVAVLLAPLNLRPPRSGPIVNP
jgi:MFS transporter, PPP family, 3-phenylpropionic acid transporter